jgi:condensin complex subunit 2
MEMIENADFNDQENAGGFGANNDDEERKQRRRSVKRSRRRSARFSLGGKGVRKTNVGEEQSVLTDFELTSMYKATIEMSTQNKITSKNAFQLQLIDRINQVVDVVTGNGGSSANENAFQHAGCVVEAAAKIYDARVEETYKNTQRFVADLARSNKKNGDDDMEEEDGATASDSAAEAARAKRSKRLGVAKTLETNLNSINITKSDLECDVNPLFEKMSQKFDEGGARGLLLGNIPITDGPKIVIGGSPVLTEDDTDATSSSFTETGAAVNPAEPVMFMLQLDTSALCKTASKRKLCTDTSSFYVWYDKYVGNVNGAQGNGSTITVEHGDTDGGMYDGIMNEDEDDTFDVAGGDGGDMYDDYDGGEDFGDDFGLCDDGNQHQQHGNNSAMGGGGSDTFEDKGPNVAMNGTSAYSYYDMSAAAPANATANWTNKKSNWAGQGHNKHWKLFDTPSSSSLSSSASKQKKKRTPKEVFVLDFSADPIDVKKAFAASRAATTQTQKSLDLQHADLKSYLLPDDAHYEMKDLSRLFFRPTAFVRADSGQGHHDMDEDGSFGEMNEGDRGDDDYGDDWGGNNDMAFGEDASVSVFSAPQNDDDLNLLEDANMTEKIDIGYATTRKVFDIKQLKGEFWSHLSATAPVKPNCKELFENIQEESKEKVDEKIEQVFEGAATFSGTLEKVRFNVVYFNVVIFLLAVVLFCFFSPFSFLFSLLFFFFYRCLALTFLLLSTSLASLPCYLLLSFFGYYVPYSAR